MQRKHKRIVETIQDQVKQYYADRKPFRIYHGSSNSTRVLDFKRNEMVDTSKLNNVLSINVSKKTAIVEPNVPMDKLVKTTLKRGLIPPVVTEFPGITVGGAIQGAAIETSSHTWGCFSQTTNWIEMILGNGKRLVVSPKKNADLYYGTAGSYGSLGVIVSTEINLISAKKYVNITHYPVGSFEEALNLADKYAKQPADFVECLMFSKVKGSIIIGELSDAPAGAKHRFTRPFDPWYYLYAEKTARSKTIVTHAIPLKDYLFRYNRGAFWGGKLAFDHFGVKFTSLNRFILDPLLRTRKLYKALQESAAAQEYICQDIVLPRKSVVPFMNYIDKEFNMYPMVFCLIKPEPRSQLLPSGIKTAMTYNVGVYGLRVTPYKKFVEKNQEIEKKTQELGGKKWFYAHSYYTESNLWKIYDKKWYGNLREKYHATTLPNIYDRTRVKEHKDVNQKKALVRTILGGSKVRVSK